MGVQEPIFKTHFSQGMCRNLVEKGNLGYPLLLYNRSTKRATDLSSTLTEGKTEVVTILEEGVDRANIVFTCLSNDEAIREIIGLALKVDVSGKLFVDCSTIHPDTSESIAKDIIAKGGQFVCAPVFGAPAMAESGRWGPIPC
jgi:3-hydroxyisobutyrate dehydrogenase-like beta-hydroxyacid dehydrogenase